MTKKSITNVIREKNDFAFIGESGLRLIKDNQDQKIEFSYPFQDQLINLRLLGEKSIFFSTKARANSFFERILFRELMALTVDFSIERVKNSSTDSIEVVEKDQSKFRVRSSLFETNPFIELNGFLSQMKNSKNVIVDSSIATKEIQKIIDELSDSQKLFIDCYDFRKASKIEKLDSRSKEITLILSHESFKSLLNSLEAISLKDLSQKLKMNLLIFSEKNVIFYYDRKNDEIEKIDLSKFDLENEKVKNFAVAALLSFSKNEKEFHIKDFQEQVSSLLETYESILKENNNLYARNVQLLNSKSKTSAISTKEKDSTRKKLKIK